MTEQSQAVYRQDLGSEMDFEAFSLDPKMDKEGLAKIVNGLAEKPRPSQEQVESVIRTGSVQWMPNLELEAIRDLDGKVVNYQIPNPLREYRKALGRSLDEKAKTNPMIFNGPVIVAEGEIKNPLRVMQGQYYDFSATQLGNKPADLLKDKNAQLTPGVYPEGKTVENILRDAGLPLEARERYFGFAHLMWPSDGKEFILVNRARGLGIAADCLSTPGSTPDLFLDKPGLKRGIPGFGIKEYWSYHMGQEMLEEFALKWGDFWVEGITLYDDTRTIPFGAINIYTEMSAKQIAQGIYHAKPSERDRVLKEHNVIFGMPAEAIPHFLERFPVFPGVTKVLNDALKERGISQ
ncbi:hypothetical protein J4429_00915 [Candidatus Pacearchaeota archaeon]|nr:hypothetical protein [Candidatus Pacearchaeota archaeon]